MNFNLADALSGLTGGILILNNNPTRSCFVQYIRRFSSIAGSLVALKLPAVWNENLLFLAGLVAAPAIYSLAVSAPDINITGSLPLLIAGGFLVGFGTGLGSGCTSGHGVCGISRFSGRSILATATFMVIAIAVVTVSRHLVAA